MHTCPDCGQACYCHGDIEDHDTGEDDQCEHYHECGSDDLFDDEEEDGFGCCYPGECCMPGLHMLSECHTAADIEAHNAHEKAVRDVAVWLMRRDGNEEDPDELIYEGGPIPEPYGLRWQKWEDEARQCVSLMTPNV